MGFHRSVHSARIFTVFSSWILSANMQSLLPLFSRLCISMSNSWSTDPQRIPLVTSLHHGNWTFTPTLFEFLVHLGICSFIPQLLAVFRRLWLGTFLNSLGKSKQNIQIHFFFCPAFAVSFRELQGIYETYLSPQKSWVFSASHLLTCYWIHTFLKEQDTGLFPLSHSLPMLSPGFP